MASAFVLKFPHVWLVSFSKSPSGFGDRVEGIVLNVRGDAIVIYIYDEDLLVEMPPQTRIVKIKPVDIAGYLSNIKECFINNYDINATTERLLRLYVADVEKKVEELRSEDVCSDDESEEDYEEEEDESENEEDSKSDESEDESDDESEDDEDSSHSDCSSSSSEEDEDSVDFKVVIDSPNMEQEIRGFCMSRRKIIKKVTKVLQDDYGSAPLLFFLDADGDQVLLKRPSDLKFALRSHNKQSKGGALLRLHARMGDDMEVLSTLRLSPEKKHKEGSEEDAPITPPGAGATMEGDVQLQDEKFHWQKGELVGAGSFGQVFGGILTQSGRRIAVKEVFLSGSKGHIEQAKALQVEIKILSTLEHPNIITYLGAEFTKTTLRIFLDLASEGSLKLILNEFGALSEPLLRRYMQDILAGLSFLHSKGIIHRDIKPSNMLLDKGTVKLADFGCSATVNLTCNDKSELQHDTVIGTTVYMSPEIMRGADDDSAAGADAASGYGRKTDIWSLGVTLSEMSTAKCPFKNAAAAIYAVCVSKEYPRLPEELSDEAVSFLGRCLVEDPCLRADTSELLAHPFCLDQVSGGALQASSTHTLSSVALLPDFHAIESLGQDASTRHGYDFNDSDDDNSFFEEQKSQRGSARRSRQGSWREEKESDFSNDITMFK